MYHKPSETFKVWPEGLAPVCVTLFLPGKALALAPASAIYHHHHHRHNPSSHPHYTHPSPVWEQEVKTRTCKVTLGSVQP